MCDFLVGTVRTVQVLPLAQRGAVRLLFSTVWTVRELSGTSGACFPFPCCPDSSSCARDCVFLTRDTACIMALENLMCPSDPAIRNSSSTATTTTQGRYRARVPLSFVASLSKGLLAVHIMMDVDREEATTASCLAA